MSNLIVFNPPLLILLELALLCVIGRSLCPQFTGSEDREESQRAAVGPMCTPQPSARGGAALPPREPPGVKESGKVKEGWRLGHYRGRGWARPHERGPIKGEL